MLWFVSKIDECSMVGHNRNKYHGVEICYIVMYYGILRNISILSWNMIYVRLQ